MIGVLVEYVVWHYSRALLDLLRVWGNFFWFFWHFFSVGLLLKTLLSPLNRINEGYKKGLYPAQWFETFIVNSLMRIVGAMVRIVVILIGITALLATLVGGIVFLGIWILAPFLLITVVSGAIGLIAM